MKKKSNFEICHDWLLTVDETAAETYIHLGEKERVNQGQKIDAIVNGIYWQTSPEGYAYWERLNKVYKKYVYHNSELTEPHHTVPTQCSEVLAEEAAVKPKHYNEDECYDVYSFAIKNNLGMLEGNVIKYVSRHDKKNGKEDLLKAIETLERLIREKY